MQRHPKKISIRLKNEEKNTADSSIRHYLGSTSPETVDIFSSEQNESPDEKCEENKPHNDPQKQLVVYNPSVDVGGEMMPIPDHHPRFMSQNSRVLPSVGAFTVQCAKCFKWRLIPTKEKYEEIREHILQNPFVCDVAREWRFEISCDDPPDICQDGSRLWAIDKPNIAQPPLGWQRLLRIRGEGCSKFADVYYVSPSGKRLRSMVEIQKYLCSQPQYTEGASISQFSFQTPKPLQQNYVRKRPHGAATTKEFSKPIPPVQVKPLSWEPPLGCKSSPSCSVAPVKGAESFKKQAQGSDKRWELHPHR